MTAGTEAGPAADASPPSLAAVVFALAAADIRERYGRGSARLAKWLLDPFALVGVYLLLVTFVLSRPGRAPGLSLACAVVPFQLLMSSVISSLGAVGRRKSIILNMRFRRELIPVAAVLTETIAFAASLLLLAVMMAGYGVAPTLSILSLPLALAETVVLALACSYPACLIGLWFPDLRNFVISFVRAVFFVAPGLVALHEIHGTTADVVRANPLTGLFESYRDALVYGQAPAAWQLLYPLAFSAALLALFWPIFRSEQSQFAKVVE